VTADASSRPAIRPGLEGIRFRFPDGELDRWLVLGDVTDRSVRVWGRQPGGPLTVRLCVDGKVVAQGTLQPDAAHDHVGAVVLSAEPRPRAAFTVEAGETEGAPDVVRSGRLAPEPGEPAAFSFLFGSCHQPFDEEAVDGALVRHAGADIYGPLRERASREDVRFALLLGDQVYSDAVSNLSVRERLAEDADLTDEELVETYRHLHRGYFNEHGFRGLQEAVPAYLTWDDHDIFDGAGSLLHETDFDRRLRRAAEAAYVEYQHLRNPGASLDDRAPYAYPVWYGNVGFFVLDLRGCREFGRRQILGDEQWRRLDAFLAEATERGVATLFIGASVPVVHASPTLMSILEGLPTSTGKDIRDRWVVPHFRHEHEALLDRLFTWQSAKPRRQVAIVSGDVHVGAAFSVRPRGRRGHLAQWTSSALSTPSDIRHGLANRLVTSMIRLGSDNLRAWRRGLVTPNNAGFVRVDPDPAGGHELTFRIMAWDPKRRVLEEALTDRSVPAA
jgi:PhoD-like phosphatase